MQMRENDKPEGARGVAVELTEKYGGRAEEFFDYKERRGGFKVWEGMTATEVEEEFTAWFISRYPCPDCGNPDEARIGADDKVFCECCGELLMETRIGY